MVYEIDAPVIIKNHSTQLNGNLQSILVYYISGIHIDNTYEVVGVLNTRAIMGSICVDDIRYATNEEELASLVATLEIFNRHRSFYKDCGFNLTYMDIKIIELETIIFNFIYSV